jgi:hypothetical protein
MADRDFDLMPDTHVPKALRERQEAARAARDAAPRAFSIVLRTFTTRGWDSSLDMGAYGPFSTLDEALETLPPDGAGQTTSTLYIREHRGAEHRDLYYWLDHEMVSGGPVVRCWKRCHASPW